MTFIMTHGILFLDKSCQYGDLPPLLRLQRKTAYERYSGRLDLLYLSNPRFIYSLWGKKYKNSLSVNKS